MADETKQQKEDHKPKYIAEHAHYIKDPKFIPKNKIAAGDIIQFIYGGFKRTVLILNPLWERKLHALDLNAIPRIFFLPILKESKFFNIPPKAFYEVRLRKDTRLRGLHAYRTFEIDKIPAIHKVEYK